MGSSNKPPPKAGRRPVDDTDRTASQDIGKRIRLRRHIEGVSQDALGAAIGVSATQVHKYENGADRIAAVLVLRIARALNAEPGYFLPSINCTNGGRKASDDLLKLVKTRDDIRILVAMGRFDSTTRAHVLRIVEYFAGFKIEGSTPHESRAPSRDNE
jgi:transcriptional regulator with XRE-family HTH domain